MMTTINSASLVSVCGGSKRKANLEDVLLIEATPGQIADAVADHKLKLPNDEDLDWARWADQCCF